MAALADLWKWTRRRPLWLPPHFWRFVRLRARSRLTQVAAPQVAHGGHAGQVNDCASCTDMCCVGAQATVLLRLRDIAALVDLKRCDLLTLQKPTFCAATLRSRPALRRQVRSESWAVFPVLRQDSMRACAALAKDTGKCSLYPHWPLACARFPYALRAEADETFYSRRCQSFWIHPRLAPRATQMAEAAVAAYNERIKDAILLAYARPQLADLGLLRHLDMSALQNP